MKKDVALKHLRVMLWSLQRFRANAFDPLFGLVQPESDPGLKITESMLEDMFPWIFGDKCPLIALADVINKAEVTGHLAPMDYYNFIFILDRFTPELRLVSAFYRDMQDPEKRLPDSPPSPEILQGWETVEHASAE